MSGQPTSQGTVRTGRYTAPPLFVVRHIICGLDLQIICGEICKIRQGKE